jgi:hypothetical protein
MAELGAARGAKSMFFGASEAYKRGIRSGKFIAGLFVGMGGIFIYSWMGEHQGKLEDL